MEKEENKVRKKNIGVFIRDHFFDFFMLFLAIVLGFYVDNYREDSENKQAASELLEDMLDDLDADQKGIAQMLKQTQNKAAKFDSLSFYLRDESKTINDSLLYIYTASIHNRILFERQSTTFSLLISTGYMRCIPKKTAAALTVYNNDYEKTLIKLAHDKQLVDSRILPFLQNIFHMENFDAINENRPMVEKPVLHNWNSESRWLLHNYVCELKNSNESIQNQFLRLKKQAELTAELLRK